MTSGQVRQVTATSCEVRQVALTLGQVRQVAVVGSVDCAACIACVDYYSVVDLTVVDLTVVVGQLRHAGEPSDHVFMRPSFNNADPTRPDPTRPDLTRPDPTRLSLVEQQSDPSEAAGRVHAPCLCASLFVCAVCLCTIFLACT